MDRHPTPWSLSFAARGQTFQRSGHDEKGLGPSLRVSGSFNRFEEGTRSTSGNPYRVRPVGNCLPSGLRVFPCLYPGSSASRSPERSRLGTGPVCRNN